jgi:hypothetical protein
MAHNPECGLDCVSAGAVRLDNTPSANQQTGRQHLSGDQSVEYVKLLKLSDAVAALLKVAVEMSDDVKRAASPLDAQGKLLRMQNSIQKNRTRIAKHINELCDLIDAQRAKAEGRDR